MGRGEGKGGERLVESDRVLSGKRRSVVRKDKISMEEVRKHRTPDDAWMVCRGKVYDVSGWREHPGGNVIFTHAGDDFTDIFAAFHAMGSQQYMEQFYIGDLEPSSDNKTDSQRNFEKAYRDLRSKLVMAGLFKVSYLYYVWKVSSNVMIWAAAWAILANFKGLGAELLSAALLALFWQQCGWLAHDFLHHQVFQNRALGDMAGIMIGNVFQGFSCAWWKNKHNTHHAVPNLVESCPGAQDGDPDIDTMPLLAWSLSMAKRAENSSLGRFFVRHQSILYFPILLVARISWLLQSFFFVFDQIPGANMWATKGAEDERQNVRNRGVEMAGLVLHYAWYGGLIFTYLSPARAILYFLTSQMMCGLMLALVFGLGHNGMSVYDADKRPDFWRLQVTTTRNITGNFLVHWFCGGLSYQVDHHLFPTVPRHRLGKVHELVESFCKENNVEYHETDMWVGTQEVLSHLSTVAHEFLTHFPAM